MSLTAPALNAYNLEGTALRLLREWLASYFDGANHTINGETVRCPSATLLFQQAVPAPGLSIHVAMVMPTRIYRAYDTVQPEGVPQEWGSARGQFFLYVRCPHAAGSTGSAPALAMQAAGVLHGLLSNSSATLPLAEKGLHHVSATVPVLVSAGEGAQGREAGKDFATRFVSMTARLRWRIHSQPRGNLVTAGGGPLDSEGSVIIDSEGSPVGGAE